MKTPWIIIIGMQMLCTFLHATPQDSDLLAYRGETYQVYPSPLELWLCHHDFPEAMETRSFSSACLNGYVCAWEINNDNLFLKKITVPSWPGWKEVPLAAVFPGHESSIHATWFTGRLISPKIRLQYVHGGAGGNYLYEKVFGFREGILIGTDIRLGSWFLDRMVLTLVASILSMTIILWLVRFRRRRTLKQLSLCKFKKEIDGINESPKACCQNIVNTNAPEIRRVIFVLIETLFLVGPLAIIVEILDILPFKLDNLILNVLICVSMIMLIGVIVWIMKYAHKDRTYANFALITVVVGVLLIFRFLYHLLYWM